MLTGKNPTWIERVILVLLAIVTTALGIDSIAREWRS